VVRSLLHGSPEAKRAGDLETQQHSRLVARGKYVHAFEVHRVQPGKSEDYKSAAEKFYTGLAEDGDLKVKVTGGWEVIVGDLDCFVHITEYENYAGYDRSSQLIAGSEHESRRKALLPLLTSRSLQLNQEFAFLPSSPPRAKGGIFELRTYQLKPGTLLEWETTWRKGIDARRKFVEPVGAWFSHIGRLHQVHHLWQYPDLQARKETRESAWQLDGWADTVHKTAQLATTMDALILAPLNYSPLK